MRKRLCTASVFLVLAAACCGLTYPVPDTIWWSVAYNTFSGSNIWFGAWLCPNVILPVMFLFLHHHANRWSLASLCRHLQVSKKREAMTPAEMEEALALAREMIPGHFTPLQSRKVARALVERMTPVWAQRAPTLLTGAWLCGACFESVEHGQRFCHMCGQPLEWMNEEKR